jgi:hypothetical protein
MVMKLSPWLALISVSLPLTSACLDGVESLDGDETLTIEGPKRAPIRVIQHNIEKKPEVLQVVLEEAAAIDAHGITLEEVCPPELAALRAKYGSKWTISSVSLGKRSANGCDLPDGTHDFTQIVAIWTGGTTGNVSKHEDLATPASVPGAMACVSFERGNVPVHLCAVHLISADFTDPATGIVYDGEKARVEETASIKRITGEWFSGAKNHFGIIGGDFNSGPGLPAMDNLYAPALGGTGSFVEYNRSGGSRAGTETAHSAADPVTGTPGSSRKIDYIFFSANRAPVDGPAVDVSPDASDHDMVTSLVSMKK